MSPEKEESKRRGRVLSSHWARVHQSITEEPVEKQGVLAILPHRWGRNRGEGTQPCGQSRDWTTGSRFPSQSCFPAPPRKGRQAGADLPDQRRCHQGGGRVRCVLDRETGPLKGLAGIQPGLVIYFTLDNIQLFKLRKSSLLGVANICSPSICSSHLPLSRLPPL